MLSGVVTLISCVAVLAWFLWWVRLRPSNDRDWSPEYQEMPWADIDGDRLTIHNFRDCEFHGAIDCTARWTAKTFHLFNLCGVDFIMSYWGSPHFAHTFL